MKLTPGEIIVILAAMEIAKENSEPGSLFRRVHSALIQELSKHPLAYKLWMHHQPDPNSTIKTN